MFLLQVLLIIFEESKFVLIPWEKAAAAADQDYWIAIEKLSLSSSPTLGCVWIGSERGGIHDRRLILHGWVATKKTNDSHFALYEGEFENRSSVRKG